MALPERCEIVLGAVTNGRPHRATWRIHLTQDRDGMRLLMPLTPDVAGALADELNRYADQTQGIGK